MNASEAESASRGTSITPLTGPSTRKSSGRTLTNVATTLSGQERAVSPSSICPATPASAAWRMVTLSVHGTPTAVMAGKSSRP